MSAALGPMTARVLIFEASKGSRFFSFFNSTIASVAACRASALLSAVLVTFSSFSTSA